MPRCHAVASAECAERGRLDRAFVCFVSKCLGTLAVLCASSLCVPSRTNSTVSGRVQQHLLVIRVIVDVQTAVVLVQGSPLESRSRPASQSPHFLHPHFPIQLPHSERCSPQAHLWGRADRDRGRTSRPCRPCHALRHVHHHCHSQVQRLWLQCLHRIPQIQTSAQDVRA